MAATYRTYVGVDISEEALAKARRHTQASGRSSKNSFVRSDFLSFVPPQQFDIILFREAMYHVPLGKVKATLDRFSKYLTNGGVFIVRMYLTDGKSSKVKFRPKAMMDIIGREFNVLERHDYPDSGATVVVFRLRQVNGQGFPSHCLDLSRCKCDMIVLPVSTFEHCTADWGKRIGTKPGEREKGIFCFWRRGLTIRSVGNFRGCVPLGEGGGAGT